MAVSTTPKPPFPFSAVGQWDQHPTNCISQPRFLASFLPRGERHLPCLGQCRPGSTRDPASSVLQRPPALPCSVCHMWTALLPQGSAPSWLGCPQSWVQATPVLPWGPPGPSVVPLSCRYFVLLAPTPVWAAPRVRSPLLDADWQHCTCDSTHHFGARSVHRAPLQVLGTQYHQDGPSSALRAAASQPGWWCAESEVQAC